jgi:hypothetical protein
MLEAVNRQHWQVDAHCRAPQQVRAIVTTIMMIQRIEHQPNSILMLLPNELLFVIFGMLPFADASRIAGARIERCASDTSSNCIATPPTKPKGCAIQ